MALVLAVIIFILTLVATAGVGFANGMTTTGYQRFSPWPVLIGGSLLALLVALTHGLHW